MDRLDAIYIFVVVVAVPGPLEGTRDRVDRDVIDGLRHDECVDYYQEYGNLARVSALLGKGSNRWALTIPARRLHAGVPRGCPGGGFARYFIAIKLTTGRKVAISGSPGVMGSLRLSTTDLVSVKHHHHDKRKEGALVSYQKYAPIATSAVDICPRED